MARELLAGLDVGTTSVKALLVTPEGEEVAIGRTPTTWTTTELGAETSAESLVDAARQALATALAQVVAVHVEQRRAGIHSCAVCPTGSRAVR